MFMTMLMTMIVFSVLTHSVAHGRSLTLACRRYDTSLTSQSSVKCDYTERQKNIFVVVLGAILCLSLPPFVERTAYFNYYYFNQRINRPKTEIRRKIMEKRPKSGAITFAVSKEETIGNRLVVMRRRIKMNSNAKLIEICFHSHNATTDAERYRRTHKWIKTFTTFSCHSLSLPSSVRCLQIRNNCC